MKIGIISINAHTKVLNFASPLHSYAFQEFLTQNGIESTIIDYKPVYYGEFDPRHPLYHYEAHPNEDPEEQKRLLEKWKDLFKERERRFDKIEAFIEKYYRKTKKCYTAKILETEDAGFDCYICVTDIIWKYNPKNGFDRGFLLACDTMKGKKKIAYAASRGVRSYRPKQAKIFFQYIKDIDYVSVREKSFQKYIRQHTGRPVKHVLDPVFFHEKEFYRNLAVHPKEKGYVLLYIVMDKSEELVRTAAAFAASRNLELIELSEDMEDAHIPEGTFHRVIYDIGIEEWLGYMVYADYIFTNSFHGSCLSIICEKQFFAGYRVGDKIDSLLEMFDLSGRRILGVHPEIAENAPDIDYIKISERRRKYVKKSEDFLLNAIASLEQGKRKKHLGWIFWSFQDRKDMAKTRIKSILNKK